ncbi:SDR family NAD(P)-dependent oxidoreductase [Mumia zhuanghuii]|uniref:SDR family oxidoreductase n=2 Tax=Mumia TaxID=1546255 RepID=A0ABW1QLB5_9ACTN|nr:MULTISPECIES: SDR family NAD(P)-dependent oxidoreductase [Mumia]KAA1422296.1 SDR family NAD(P)-dependent oxidoreductase [Mumia zhuanghuii]
MELDGKVAVVTGGGGGIGGALARRFVAAGARVLVTDLDAAMAETVAAEIEAVSPGSAVALGADAADVDGISAIVGRAEDAFGPVDLYAANAGVGGAPGLGSEAQWDLALDVNLRAHVRAADVLVPRWLERGSGYFVSTASAAGLLTQVGSAAYAVTKHAAVGFAEWLSMTYGDQGIGVSCLCPMGVETALLRAGERSGDPLGEAATRAVTSAGDVLTPEAVADDVVRAVTAGEFLVLPHPQVLDMYRQKGADYDRWIRGMRRYQASLLADRP